MRQRSELRNRALWNRQNIGGSQWEYFADVFDRWMRMFGPRFAARPASRYLSATRNPGLSLLNSTTEHSGVVDAIHRILGCIPHHGTQRAFEGHVFGGRQDSDYIIVVYINGSRYMLCEPKKIKRLGELFMLYSLLAPNAMISEMMDGVGNMMEGFAGCATTKNA